MADLFETNENDPTGWIYKMDSHVNIENQQKHKDDRVKDGFSFYDWTSFHSYLTFVILGGLRKFRTDGCGHPGDLTEQEWDDILAQMIEGFEAERELDTMESWIPRWAGGTQTHDEWAKPLQEKFDNGMRLFAQYYQHLWD